MNIKQERPQLLAESKGAKIEAGETSSMPTPPPAVNLESPKLWRALRKFNRNFKRIGRLQEENSALLGEMHRLQGVL